MKRILAVWMMLVCLSLLVCGTGCHSDATTGDKTIRITLDTMPDNLDPQLAESDETLLLVRNAFEGLFRADGGEILPAACEQYRVSEDGLTYTFTLREGLTWSDGSPLTAADFRFGLVRALRPETQAPNAERLLRIVNAAEVLAGTADEATLGIEAKDDRTLVIRLTQRDDSLPETLTYAMTMPCKESLFLQAAGRYGMTDKQILFNGPFALSQWDESTLRLTRNDCYVGAFPAKPAAVVLRFGGTDNERIESVNNDFTDLIALNTQSATVAEDARLSVRLFQDTTWLTLINPEASVLGDPAVSEAFRTALGADLLEGNLPDHFQLTARIIADDLLVGTDRYRDLVSQPSASSARPAEAKAKLIAALKPYGGSLPTITLLYADVDGMRHTANLIAQHFQKELGAVVNIEARSIADLVRAVESQEYQLALCPITAVNGKAQTQLRNYLVAMGAGEDMLSRLDAVSDLDADAAAEAIRKLESDALADSHVFPVAQSGRCFAMTDALTDVQPDLCQGLIALYRAGKRP